VGSGNQAIDENVDGERTSAAIGMTIRPRLQSLCMAAPRARRDEDQRAHLDACTGSAVTFTGSASRGVSRDA
jgi:hypothetical protein